MTVVDHVKLHYMLERLVTSRVNFSLWPVAFSFLEKLQNLSDRVNQQETFFREKDPQRLHVEHNSNEYFLF
jgi:hypothetical protein